MSATTRSPAIDQPPPVDVIEPSGRWRLPDLRPLWTQRELLLTLARRDLTVRYKQTLAGVAWVVLQPVAYAAVYSIALTFLRATPGEFVPYPLLALTGLTLWLLFSGVVSRTAGSLIAASSLIKRLMFPRLLLPAAALLPQLVDLAISFVVLIGVMLVYGVIPEAKILLAPIFVVLALGVSWGIGVWYAAIAVRYRDIQQIVPFTLQLLLYTSPVIYTLDLVPEKARTIMSLNPLSGVFEGWRWAVLPGASSPSPLAIFTAVLVGLILVVTGLIYFRRAEEAFADVI
jgi:lipopolysaccharide transport system permease protein